MRGVAQTPHRFADAHVQVVDVMFFVNLARRQKRQSMRKKRAYERDRFAARSNERNYETYETFTAKPAASARINTA